MRERLGIIGYRVLVGEVGYLNFGFGCVILDGFFYFWGFSIIIRKKKVGLDVN